MLRALQTLQAALEQIEVAYVTRVELPSEPAAAGAPPAAARVTLRCAVRFVGDWPCVPRIGLQLRAPRALSRVEWLGLGPSGVETYPDRRAAGVFGKWDGAVEDQFVPYVVPFL